MVGAGQRVRDGEHRNPVNYQALAKFRHHIRTFFAFSETALHNAGLKPAQYQAMLVIQASAEQGQQSTASTLASELFIQLNTAVELVDRIEATGFAVRHRSMADRRIVYVELTEAGRAVLAPLAALHLDHHRNNMDGLLGAMRELAA